MNNLLIAMLCGGANFIGFSQGLVIFSNTPETLISTTANGNTSTMHGPVGSYYFGLLISPSPSGPFGFPGVYATNLVTANGGQFDGGTVLVPGWQPGTTMSYIVVGWGASLGTTFNPSWLSSPPAGLFYYSAVGSGVAGGGPQNLPPLPLFGGTGISSGFSFGALGYPGPMPVLAPIIKINPAPAGVVLTWPSGKLQQADQSRGPYMPVTNASSPYIITNLSTRKFYRLGP